MGPVFTCSVSGRSMHTQSSILLSFFFILLLYSYSFSSFFPSFFSPHSITFTPTLPCQLELSNNRSDQWSEKRGLGAHSVSVEQFTKQPAELDLADGRREFERWGAPHRQCLYCNSVNGSGWLACGHFLSLILMSPFCTFSYFIFFQLLNGYFFDYFFF